MLSLLKKQFANKKKAFLIENKGNSLFEAFLILLRKKQIEVSLNFLEEKLEGKDDWRIFFGIRDIRKKKEENEGEDKKRKEGKKEVKKEEENKEGKEMDGKVEDEERKKEEGGKEGKRKKEGELEEWLSRVEEEIGKRVEKEDGEEGTEEEEWKEVIRKMRDRHQQIEKFLEEENMAIMGLNEGIKESEEKSNNLAEIAQYLSV